MPKIDAAVARSAVTPSARMPAAVHTVAGAPSPRANFRRTRRSAPTLLIKVALAFTPGVVDVNDLKFGVEIESG